jgi:hypothetical protein
MLREVHATPRFYQASSARGAVRYGMPRYGISTLNSAQLQDDDLAANSDSSRNRYSKGQVRTQAVSSLLGCVWRQPVKTAKDCLSSASYSRRSLVHGGLYAALGQSLPNTARSHLQHVG